MSPMLIKTISTGIMNLMTIFVTKKITESNIKLCTFRNFFWYFLGLLPCFILYTSGYDVTTFLTFFFLVISIKEIFNLDITISTILVLFIMIIAVLPDLLGSIIVINFIEFEKVRSNFIFMLITSLIIATTTYLIISIPFIKSFIKTSIEKAQKPENRKMLIFGVFVLLAICMAYVTTSGLFMPTKNYFMANIVILVFIGLLFTYINEVIKYDKLQMQNDTLYECMKNVEDYQEQQDLKIHEYKNQLSKIVAITKDKKVLKMLENILQIDLTTDNYILGQLKYIPKGEIKSLVYYKLLVASKQGLNILVDVSPKIKANLFNLSEKANTELSQLLGIYFDNAIESSFVSQKKILSLEIYALKGNLTFVIMNTYKEKVDINNMTKKGFTTKGAGHGKGLYFAKKIVNKSSFFTVQNEFISDYYMQKITIKKD